MTLHNHTPFVGLSWINVDQNNYEYVTTLCRVKFKLEKSTLDEEWRLKVDQQQGDLFVEDIYYGDNLESSIRYESDLIPHKKYTDIIINAKSYNLLDESKWFSSVTVCDNKGQKTNYSSLRVGSLSFGSKKSSINIKYENSKGGILAIKGKNTDNEVIVRDMYNPVGCGKLTPCREDVIIDYGDNPIKEAPAGFGVIHRNWQSRLKYAGTYDEEWQEHQSPLLPKDFDDAYYQAAHPKLITKKYLQGGEKITMVQLMKDFYKSTLIVPNLKFLSRTHTVTQTKPAKMNLDTFIIDISSDNISDYHVYASWRSRVKIYDKVLHSELIYVPSKEF